MVSGIQVKANPARKTRGRGRPDREVQSPIFRPHPAPPVPVPASLVRELDRIAIESCGVEGLFLMETAAHSLLGWVLSAYPTHLQQGARILVGKGHNGGDGLALGRLLRASGIRVEICLTFDPEESPSARGDAEQNWALARALGIPARGEAGTVALVREATPFPGLWVDALLGTGFLGSLRPELAGLIDSLNGRAEAVVSVDVPSGLDATSGLPGPVAVRARGTGTLGASKEGLASAQARTFTGELVVLPIGWPAEVSRRLSG